MNSINLLPPDIKSGIEQKKKNRIILSLFYKSILLTLAIVIITAATFLYLDKSNKNASEEIKIAEEQISGYGQLEEQSIVVSEKLTSIKTIEGKLNHWADVVAEIQKVMPSGVYLSRATLDSNSKTRGELSGFAKSKTGVATLRDAMENSDLFEYVDIETTSTETNPKTGMDLESFTLSFSLEKGALDE